MFKFSILTFGCKMNQYESGIIRQKLLSWGGEEVDWSEAEYLFVNTCAVTNKTEQKILKQMRKIKRRNPGIKIVFMGCFPQVYQDKLKELPYLDYLMDNKQKEKIEEYLRETLDWKIRDEEQDIIFTEKTRGFFKVTDGCNRRCSYCVIWKARGEIVSLSLGEVMEKLKKMYLLGMREVVLLGTQLASYGEDWGGNLRILLDRLVKEFKGKNFRIRLSSLEPMDFSLFDDVMWAIEEGVICPHLHIAVQNLSTPILKGMNRHYTFQEIDTLMEKLSGIDNLSVGFDIITGFPGESEEDFRFNLENLEKYKGLLSYLHVFPFSPKKGTPAEKMDNQVSEKEKKERVALLNQLSHRLREYYYQKYIGQPLEVLIEDRFNKGGWEGITDNFVKVVVDTDKTLHSNQLVSVKGSYLNGFNTNLRLFAKLY